MPSYFKEPTHRSQAWLRAVASLPCVVCMKDGPSQAAHINHRGKGMAMKAPDVWTFPMCPACHAEFDQGKSYTKEERRELADTWVLMTILNLASQGKVVPK